MGLFSKLLGKKRGIPEKVPVGEELGQTVEQEASPAKQKPSPPPEPQYTQEELFDKLMNGYEFGIRYGEKYMPQIDDLTMLQRLKDSARHPRAKYLAGERYKEVLARRRAEAKAHVKEISSQEELVALAEDEEADRVLREVAAKAVTDQDVLKRWAIEEDKTSFLSMVKRIKDPADLVDIARNARDKRTRTLATQCISDEAGLQDMAQNAWGDRELAAKKLGGYICTACGEAVLPKGEATVPCTCPACGAQNHVWQRVNNVREYRDYEVGEWHDECVRCGETANHHSVNTW